VTWAKSPVTRLKNPEGNQRFFRDAVNFSETSSFFDRFGSVISFFSISLAINRQEAIEVSRRSRVGGEPLFPLLARPLSSLSRSAQEGRCAGLDDEAPKTAVGVFVGMVPAAWASPPLSTSPAYHFHGVLARALGNSDS
jgi:hypothetical protein